MGTLYLAQGFGNIGMSSSNSSPWQCTLSNDPIIVGARISGRISDRTVSHWIERRGGKWVPEDRLRASLIFAGIVTPATMFALGFTMQFWTTSAGLAISLLLLFISGIGVS